ncbi:YeiH family protein [Jatrophihabitans endophyticus]|uniref:YeiH family protein n=1 Tax=Jatrophihabitans endophyticus TaxID=1206085 RepID=UPI001A0E182B|nr:putative sulfate exporter family transporter [Jatrophihabitans endophyticus]MBE7190042.1 putative sulfate exporter family transporter [Jatrophihabitans endophyticus]
MTLRPLDPVREPVLVARSIAPGLLLCAVIAAVATLAAREAPVVGAPVIAIVVGVVVRLLVGPRPAVDRGVTVARTTVLQLAVVVLGTQLSLAQVVHVGLGSLPVMLGTLAVCLIAAAVVGRRMGIERDLRTLIGVGTGICGASAIAAASPVIRAKSGDVAYAISTIFVFNVAAVLAFPPLGHALGLSQHDFGLFAGTAVNDMSSVVATASVYGHAAADHAVVVKLVRTLMIVPICLGLAALRRRSGGDDATAVRAMRLVPWFLVGFVLVAAANSVGLVPDASHAALADAATLLITVALAGIGLSTDVGALRRTGARPLVLGFVLWVTVTATSLLLQTVAG